MRRSIYVLAVLFVAAGMVLPTATAAPLGTNAAPTHPNDVSLVQDDGEDVNVSVGQQLSTVLAVTNDEVQSEVEHSVFEVEIENADGTDRTRIVNNRSAALLERASEVRAEYEAATAAYESGEITQSEYGQRIATLNARAETIVSSLIQLRQQVRNDSDAEIDEAAVQGAIDDVSAVRGKGPTALLEMFTGERTGDVEIDRVDGMRIEVEGEDGERERELRRPDARDDVSELSVDRSAAYETARSWLSQPENGSWVLERTKIHDEDGDYEFEFLLDSTASSGEAEIRVDGSTGEAYRLEEGIEAETEDDDADERELRRPDARDNSTEFVVNESDALATAQSWLSDPQNGSWVLERTKIHDEDGDYEFEFLLESAANSGEAEVRVDGSTGEAFRLEEKIEGEESDEHEDENETEDRKLAIEVTEGDPGPGETVTLEVTDGDAAVPNATVLLNDEQAGTTDADGQITVTFPSSEDVDVDAEKGEAAGEREFEFEHETEHETEHENLGDLSIHVAEGNPGPGETVTLEVTAEDGSPVDGASVRLNDEQSGTTDADGQITVTFPNSDRVDVEAERNDADGDRRFEFEDDDG